MNNIFLNKYHINFVIYVQKNAPNLLGSYLTFCEECLYKDSQNCKFLSIIHTNANRVKQTLILCLVFRGCMHIQNYATLA